MYRTYYCEAMSLLCEAMSLLFLNFYIQLKQSTNGMIGFLIVVLIILWFFGYVNVGAFPPLDIELFSINGQPITLWNILILLVVGWAIGILPSPFRQIASVLLILWILSVLGIFAIAGLSSLLVIAIILGLVASFLGFGF